MPSKNNWTVVQYQGKPIPGFMQQQRNGGIAYRFRVGQGWHAINGYPTPEEARLERMAVLGTPKNERVRPSNVKFVDYASAWLDRQTQLKPKSRKSYSDAIRLYLTELHSLKVSDITVDAIRQHVLAPMKARKMGSGTIGVALVPLSGICNALVDDHVLPANPVGALQRRDRPKRKRKAKRIITPQQAATLLAPENARKYRPMIATGLFAGLRLSEVLGLVWQDIDFDAGIIRVRFQLSYEGTGARVSLKGDDTEGKERDVELSQTLARILRGQMDPRGVDPHGFVFAATVYSKCPQENLENGHDRAAERAGITGTPKLTFHQLRHNYASALIASGADVGFVSDQLGHASTSMTLDIYRSEFKAAREAGSAGAAIDAIYGSAMS